MASVMCENAAKCHNVFMFCSKLIPINTGLTFLTKLNFFVLYYNFFSFSISSYRDLHFNGQMLNMFLPQTMIISLSINVRNIGDGNITSLFIIIKLSLH